MIGPVDILRRILRKRWTLLAVALVAGVIGAWPAFESGLTPPEPHRDLDVTALERGLEKYQDFGDTFSWFTGYWIGLNPFWRPLSSYAFWTLHKVLGWENHDRYELVRAVCHVIVTGMLFWFVMVVTGRPLLALLAVAMQNLLIPLPVIEKLYTPVGVTPVARWISLPDIWLAMVTLPALWLAWRGKLWWSVPLVAAAAMLKETGFVVFPLVMLFYWWRHRRLHPAFVALIAIAVVFAALKLTCVGPGWILGSNRSIWTRMARFALPRPINYMLTGSIPWTLMGIGAGIAVIVGCGPRRRPRLALAIITGSLIASLVAYRYAVGIPGGSPDWDIALAGLFERRLYSTTTPQIAVWVIAAWAGLRGPDRRLVVLLVIAHLVMGLPATIAPQTGTRSLYTAMLFSSVISAICAWSLPLVFGRPVREQPAVDRSDTEEPLVENA